MTRASRPNIEWPTVAMVAACTAIWLCATYVLGQWSTGWGVVAITIIAALMVTLHSSLQHEALHGHPTRNRWFNEALVFLPVGLFVPYRRFRTTHLIHHNDPNLTDPFEDPESNYLAPADWERLPAWVQAIRRFNNSLLGRLLIGPALGVTGFIAADMRCIVQGDRRVLQAWLLHAVGLVAVVGWLVGVAGVHLGFYALAIAYPGYSLLTLRTFAEHQAAPDHAKRTAIVEDGGVLGLLFLNNNLHVVHHMHPTTPWYELPALYQARKHEFLAHNGHYFYPSYWALFRAHALQAKEPVPHPLMDATRDANRGR